MYLHQTLLENNQDFTKKNIRKASFPHNTGIRVTSKNAFHLSQKPCSRKYQQTTFEMFISRYDRSNSIRRLLLGSINEFGKLVSH